MRFGDTPIEMQQCGNMPPMTMNAYADDHDREAPEWELQDRLHRTLRLIPMNVNEISDVLDVSRHTVGNWLNGRSTPKRSALMWWADAADVPLLWLETGRTTGQVAGGPRLYGIRDSNPEPADLESRPSLRLIAGLGADNSGLSADRRLSVVRGIAS